MGDQQGAERKLPDPLELSRTMTEIAEQSQRLVTDFLQKQSQANGDAFGMSDPLNIGQAFLEMTARLMAQPEKLVQAQMSLWSDYMNLWQTTARRMMGGPAEPVIAPAPDDRRFKDAAWQDNELFDFVKQSYLLTAR
jgi:polyhydroxyalkanoate synthase